MNLARALGSVGGLTLVSRVLALVRDSLLARYVGASFASDAFLVAFRLPNMFRALFAEGAFSAAFIPMFNRKVGEGRRAWPPACAFAERRAVGAAAGPARCSRSSCSIAAWPVTWALSGGFNGIRRTSSSPSRSTLSRITIPYLMLISLVSLLGGILNSLAQILGQRRRADPAQRRDDRRAVCSSTAHEPLRDRASQAIAVTVGGVLQLALADAGLPGERASACRLRRPRLDADVQAAAEADPARRRRRGRGADQPARSRPRSPAGCSPPGSISYIYYADRLNQLPLGLIGIGLGTVLLPTISRLLGARRGCGGDGDAEPRHRARAVPHPARDGRAGRLRRADRPRPVPARRSSPPTTRVQLRLGARRLLDRPALLRARQGADPRLLCARRHEDAGALRDRSRSAVNLVAQSRADPVPLAAMSGRRSRPRSPPRSTSGCSTATLRKRGHFEADARLRRRVPRLALAALLMGVALFWFAPAARSLSHRHRSCAALGGLAVLVGAGGAVYALACFVTGAFVLDDLKALIRKRRPSMTDQQEHARRLRHPADRQSPPRQLSRRDPATGCAMQDEARVPVLPRRSPRADRSTSIPPSCARTRARWPRR